MVVTAALACTLTFAFAAAAHAPACMHARLSPRTREAKLCRCLHARMHLHALHVQHPQDTIGRDLLLARACSASTCARRMGELLGCSGGRPGGRWCQRRQPSRRAACYRPIPRGFATHLSCWQHTCGQNLGSHGVGSSAAPARWSRVIRAVRVVNMWRMRRSPLAIILGSFRRHCSQSVFSS